jgi:hypothetical protein
MEICYVRKTSGFQRTGVWAETSLREIRKEAAAKTQNTLILQRIIALQTIKLRWNIHFRVPEYE